VRTCDADTPMIQLPLTDNVGSRVISIVVGWVAVMFGWPRAEKVKTSSLGGVCDIYNLLLVFFNINPIHKYVHVG